MGWGRSSSKKVSGQQRQRPPPQENDEPQQQWSSTDQLHSELRSTRNRNSRLLQDLKINSNNLTVAREAIESFKSDNSKISKQLQSTRAEADWMKQTNAECTNQIRGLVQTLTEKEKQLAKSERIQVHERQRHVEAVNKYNREIRSYQQQAESLKTEAKKERQKLEFVHQQQTTQLADERDRLVTQMKAELAHLAAEEEKKRRALEFAHHQQTRQHVDERERLVTQMKADWAHLTAEEDKKRQNLIVVHDEQKAQILQEHEKALLRINDELAEVKQTNELEISELQNAHTAALHLKDLNYDRGTRQIRDDVQRLNAALLTRDDQVYQGELFTTSNLPTRPDEQIRGKFSEIEQMVDSLGRLQWKQDPAVWTTEVLRSVGRNSVDRALKKAIVQDHVWTFLFNYIFCSPFRVFGAEGRLLEEEWNRQCALDEDSNNEVFTWPEPGAKTERWRYMTVKECLETLRPPVPSEWDPRRRLRKGFTDNLKEFVSELKASMEQIIDLTPADITMIDRLPKKAANVWLDLSIHRCRIVIRLKGSVALSMEEKVATAQGSSLELTVVPVVARYGNVTGADLDMEKIIDRCKGESIVIPS